MNYPTVNRDEGVQEKIHGVNIKDPYRFVLI